jgi:hypothetical protein
MIHGAVEYGVLGPKQKPVRRFDCQRIICSTWSFPWEHSQSIVRRQINGEWLWTLHGLHRSSIIIIPITHTIPYKSYKWTTMNNLNNEQLNNFNEENNIQYEWINIMKQLITYHTAIRPYGKPIHSEFIQIKIQIQNRYPTIPEPSRTRTRWTWEQLIN